MLDVSRYSAANALIRARLSRRISRQTWERLLLASGLQEALEVLMGSVYRETLASVPVEEPDAGDIECRLREYMARGFRAPLPFLPGDTRKLLDWRWRRFEVDNLKMILRAVERNVPPGEIRNTLVPLGLASELPWDSLSESISVSALVERLGDSFYAQMLKPALDVYRRDGQLFVLEIRLDLTYLQRLRSIMEGLAGRNQKEARRFLGEIIDSQIALWAFRYRIHYRLSPEEIINYTLQRGVRVDVDTVREIATGARLVDVLREIWDGELPGVGELASLSEQDALVQAELVFNRYFYHLAEAALMGNPLHLGVILAYQAMLETEVRDLISIVEGKAAGWSLERIRPYLIVKRG